MDGARVGLPSDDTQLAFWTLEQLLQDGSLEPERLAHRFARGNIRGIGQTVLKFLINLHRGVPWYAAGPESAGNGALMRIAPVLIPHLPHPSTSLWGPRSRRRAKVWRCSRRKRCAASSAIRTATRTQHPGCRRPGESAAMGPGGALGRIQRRLAGNVRAQQPVHATRDGQGHVVEGARGRWLRRADVLKVQHGAASGRSDERPEAVFRATGRTSPCSRIVREQARPLGAAVNVQNTQMKEVLRRSSSGAAASLTGIMATQSFI
jgi:hypothetical protein